MEWIVEAETLGDLVDGLWTGGKRLVRCKDCKHRGRYECNHIRLGETKCGVTDDWYCADGERKDDADNR